MSRVFSIGAKDHPFVLPYWCLSFDELGWFLVDRRGASETVQDGNLRDKIFAMRQASSKTANVGTKQAKLTENEVTADSPLPFNVRELWYHFDRLERVTYREMARTTEARVERGQCTYPNFRAI